MRNKHQICLGKILMMKEDHFIDNGMQFIALKVLEILKSNKSLSTSLIYIYIYI